MAVSMVVARVVHCQLSPPGGEGPTSPESSRAPDQVKMVVQNRPCTLRSYASDRGVLKRVINNMMMRNKKRRRSLYHHQDDQINGSGLDHDHRDLDRVVDHQAMIREEEEEELDIYPLFGNLVEKIEGSKKGYYLDIITGRLAMVLILFAATVGMELVTGDTVFKTMDAQGIAESVLGCLAASTCAAFFARSSTARRKVVQIFNISFSVFFEALIENILNDLFLDSDLDDPFDDNFN